jgi:ribosomal protein S13
LATKKQLLKRFELNLLYNNYLTLFSIYDKDMRKSINILLSQISSVNNQLIELERFNLIRLYLIKSFRGKAQALGKPSRGQRT